MEKLLLTVGERFQIRGRGLVLVPEVPADLIRVSGLKSIVPVCLMRPDGSELLTQAILRREHFCPSGYKWMCYPEGVEKSDIPIGTEVWLTSNEAA